MPSEVAICNQALGWLGASLITSLDDPSVQATLCKDNFATLRDATLEDAQWTFAVARASVTEDPDPPEWGWDHRFRIPNDVLMVVGVQSNPSASKPRPIEYVREGKYLLTNYAQTLYIRYIKRVTDPNEFPPGYTQCLAARIAADLCVPLTRNPKLMETMWGLYDEKRRIAAKEMMQGTREMFESSVLNDARRGNGAAIGFNTP